MTDACSERDLGSGLLARWKASGTVMCAAPPRTAPWRAARGPTSTITVHTVHQHGHDAEDAFYVVRNLYLDPRRPIRVVRPRTGGPVLAVPRGALRAACRPTAAWRRAPAPLTLADLKAGIALGWLPRATAADDVPTLLAARDGTANVFHALADLVNAYLVREMLGYRRIVLLDDEPDGPLLPLWRVLGAGPPRRLHELPGPRILRTAIFAPPGGSCFLWKHHWEVSARCRREAPLLTAFRRTMLAGLGLGEAPAAPTAITVVHRPPGTTRRLANEGELLAALAALAPGLEVRAVDLAELPYVEQIRIMRATRVLVGVSAAGLTNLVWLPPGAAVVELVPSPAYQPACFGNLAAWSGVRYAAWSNQALAPREVHLGADVPAIVADVVGVAALVRPLLAAVTAPSPPDG